MPQRCEATGIWRESVHHRFAGGADPIGSEFGEADVLEMGGGEHGGDLQLRETLLKSGAKAVEGVGAHGVEAAFGIELERPGIRDREIFGKASEREINYGGDNLRSRVAEGEWKATCATAKQVGDFPQTSEPSGPIIKSVI